MNSVNIRWKCSIKFNLNHLQAVNRLEWISEFKVFISFDKPDVFTSKIWTRQLSYKKKKCGLNLKARKNKQFKDVLETKNGLVELYSHFYIMMSSAFVLKS